MRFLSLRADLTKSAWQSIIKKRKKRYFERLDLWIATRCVATLAMTES